MLTDFRKTDDLFNGAVIFALKYIELEFGLECNRQQDLILLIFSLIARNRMEPLDTLSTYGGFPEARWRGGP